MIANLNQLLELIVKLPASGPESLLVVGFLNKSQVEKLKSHLVNHQNRYVSRSVGDILTFYTGATVVLRQQDNVGLWSVGDTCRQFIHNSCYWNQWSDTYIPGGGYEHPLGISGWGWQPSKEEVPEVGGSSLSRYNRGFLL